MAWTLEDCVQRDHFFAVVDEVDSILIDEARTPLIIVVQLIKPPSGMSNLPISPPNYSAMCTMK